MARPYYGGEKKGALELEADKLLENRRTADAHIRERKRKRVVKKLAAGKKLDGEELAEVEKVMRREVLAGDEDGPLEEEEVKELLKFRPKDVKALHKVIDDPDRNAMAQIQGLKLKAQYTLSQPKQEFGGDIGVQVVVNTLRKEGYVLPKGSTSAALPGKVEEDGDGDE